MAYGPIVLLSYLNDIFHLTTNIIILHAYFKIIRPVGRKQNSVVSLGLLPMAPDLCHPNRLPLIEHSD